MTYWLTANTLHCSLWCNCAIVFGKFWPLIWQRIACSVREQPLYPQPPAGQLKITPRHNSHKMKLHCEESYPFSTKTVTCVSSVDFIYELGVTELPQYCLVHQAVMKKKTLCISLRQHWLRQNCSIWQPWSESGLERYNAFGAKPALLTDIALCFLFSVYFSVRPDVAVCLKPMNRMRP